MEWRTPPHLFAALDRRFKFNYDAFASHENALCDAYSTVEGTFYQPYRPGNAFSPLDGLNHSWAEVRVFMNPPYSRYLIEQCVRKAFDERNRAEIIVALLPAATETHWFQRYILPHCHIDWLPKRVRFIHPDEPCQVGCMHALGQPGPSPTTGHIVATFRVNLLG